MPNRKQETRWESLSDAELSYFGHLEYEDHQKSIFERWQDFLKDWAGKHTGHTELPALKAGTRIYRHNGKWYQIPEQEIPQHILDFFDREEPNE